jgi:amino acid adenylation domain-containing protein
MFDTVLVFENYPVDTAFQGRDTTLRFDEVHSIDTTNYPLTLNIVARDGITIQYQYARAEFDDDVIERLGRQFEALLEQIVDNPSRCIGEVRLARSDEHPPRAEVIEAPADWRDEPVHLSIARQARAAPSRPALWCAGETLSYGELDQLSNGVAHRLRRLGVGPDVPVGLLIERSFDMVIGILGILKAGGAYVPLEPEAPDERIGYMLATASVGVVVTQRRFVHRLHAVDVQTLVLDSDEAIDEPSSLPDVQLSPDNLAYVIYTSGSTGRPKGAANTHFGLSNRLRWMQHAYGLGADETVLQKTPFGFDVSVWEFIWPLMVGARLVLAAPGEHRDPALLVALIREQGVTTVHFVPSMLRAFLEAEGVNRCSSLRRIVASGEELPVDVEARFFERLPAASLYNLYGPTEASIDVTHWTCTPTPATDSTSVPIGRPIAHTLVRVLDVDLNDLPPGVAGELYIGGIGLARGYYNQPALTAERFVPDAESSVPGARLYRTGDRAALREDGSLTFLGRLDNQVKLRGFRIELGEIERHLLGHGDVTQAVIVIRRDQAAAHLLAYAVPRPGVPRDDLVDRLTRHLRLALPEYMVPSRFVFLDELPQLPNGKIDRKALTSRGPAEETREAPRGDLEETLASMWQDLLGVSQVGRHDHFFELGGHSLLAVQLVSRIKQTLGVDVMLREVFDAPRLEALARTLNERLTVVRAAGRAIENDVAAAMDEVEAMSAQALEAFLAADGEKPPLP